MPLLLVLWGQSTRLTTRAPRFGWPPAALVEAIPVHTTSVNQPVIDPDEPRAVKPVRWNPTQAITWYCAFAPVPLMTSYTGNSSSVPMRDWRALCTCEEFHFAPASEK